VALAREEVVRVALDLLDEVGLDGLSLRRLAARLDIQAPTLYWHFRNKRDLIDEMAATMMAVSRFEPPREIAWDQWLTWLAMNTYAAMRSHRDGALLYATAQPSPKDWEVIVPMLRAAGFSQESALRAMAVLTDYVLGAALAGRSVAELGVELVIRGIRPGGAATTGRPG
jgi:TetR/AcrR family tetracycline transcriptional repressor